VILLIVILFEYQLLGVIMRSRFFFARDYYYVLLRIYASRSQLDYYKRARDE